MDVTKAPPADLTSQLGTGTVTSSAPHSGASASSSAPSNASTTVTAAADRLDIQPLDIAAALQILIAEVRAELPLPGVSLPVGAPLEIELAALGQPANPPPPSQRVTPGEPGSQASPPGIATPTPPPTPASAALAWLESAVSRLNASIEGSAPGTSLLPLPGRELPPPDVVEVPARPAGPVSSPETAPGWAAPAPLVAPRPGWISPAPPPALESPDPNSVFGMGRGADVDEAGAGASADSAAGAGLGSVPRPGDGPPRTGPPNLAAPGPDVDPLESLLMPAGGRLSLPNPLTLLSSPAQASPVLMRLFLQAVPDDVGNPAAWAATVSQLEVTLQSALDRAVSAVEQWHDVPQVVVDAARDTRTLVMSQLNDGPPNPLWLRPEWMWLTPRMELFRRRRRLARRGLTDPDLWARREAGLEPEPVRKDPEDGGGAEGGGGAEEGGGRDGNGHQ